MQLPKTYTPLLNQDVEEMEQNWKNSLFVFFSSPSPLNIRLFERQSDRKAERDLPSIGSLLKWLQHPGLGQPGARDSVVISHVNARAQVVQLSLLSHAH